MLRKTVVPIILCKNSLCIWIKAPTNSVLQHRQHHTLGIRFEPERYHLCHPGPALTLTIAPSRELHLSAPLHGLEVVKAPSFPEAITEGTAKLMKKVGDGVEIDDVVVEIETDKTALPVGSPFQGKITKFLVQEGGVVKAYTPLFEIDVGVAGAAPAAAAPAAAPAAPAAAPAAKPAPAAAPGPAPVIMAKPAPPAPKQDAGGLTPAAARVFDPSQMIQGTRAEYPVGLSKMRKKIAERLKEAQNTCAMLTTFNECDMSNLMDFRKKNLESFKTKYGVKLSFMSPFLKAAANALIDQPIVNGFIDGDNIIYRDYVDISVAVATPRGLVVPVIRNVESMNYPKIELTLNFLGQRARAGQLAVAEMQGGTFTISNGGVFGSLLSMPIINMPQSAILGMHAIQMRPIVVGKKIKVRPMMYLALSYDHRLIDGREAVLFLRKIKDGVENPTTILAGI